MAETVEANARMLKNTLDALATHNVPLQRIVLALMGLFAVENFGMRLLKIADPEIQS